MSGERFKMPSSSLMADIGVVQCCSTLLGGAKGSFVVNAKRSARPRTDAIIDFSPFGRRPLVPHRCT